MGFELPDDTTPVKKPTSDRLAVTPIPSKNMSNPNASQEEGNHDTKELRRKLQETERALKRAAIENEKLKDQMRERIRARHDEAQEKKRQRDEANITGRRQNQETVVQLREERGRNETLNTRLTQIESERDMLKKEVNQTKSHYEELVKAKDEIESKFNTTKAELISQSAISSKNDGEIKNLDERLKERSDEVILLRGSIQQLEQKLVDYKNELERSQMGHQNLADELTQSRMDHVKNNDLLLRLQELNQNLNSKNMENAELTERVAKLSSDSVDYARQINLLNKEKNSKEHEVLELKNQNSNLDTVVISERKKVSSLQAEIRQLMHESTSKEQKLFHHKQKSSQLKEEQQAHTVEIELLRSQLTTMGRNMAEAIQEKGKMEMNMKSMQNDFIQTKGSLEEHLMANKKYNEDISRLKEDILKRESEIRDSHDEISLLNARIEDGNAKFNDLKTTLDESLIELADHRARKGITSKNLGDLTTRNADLKTKNTDLEKLVEKKNKEIEEHIFRQNTMKSELSQAQQLLQECKNEANSLPTRIEFLVQERSQNIAQIDELTTKLNIIHDELENLKSHAHEVSSQNTQLKLESKDTLQKLQLVSTELKQTEKRQVEAEQELAEAQKRNQSLQQQCEQNEKNRLLEGAQLSDVQTKYQEENLRLRNTLLASEAASNLYQERVAGLQIEIESLKQKVQKSELRASVLENEIQLLERVSDDLQMSKEKHLEEVSEMQSNIDQLEQRQTDAARQLHRLLKDLREANGETMDVIRWRDEERDAYDEIKKTYEALQKQSTEEITEIRNELYKSKLANEESMQSVEGYMREIPVLERKLQQREDENFKVQLEIATCREELKHERVEHNILEEKYMKSKAEGDELRRFTSLMKDDIQKLNGKNWELDHKLSNLIKDASELREQKEQFQRSLMMKKDELETVKEAEKKISQEFEHLRYKYRSLNENKLKMKESLDKQEEITRQLKSALNSEKDVTVEQKSHYEQLIRNLHNKYKDGKKEIEKNVRNNETMKNELEITHGKVTNLVKEIQESNSAAEKSIQNAHQERDLFIKKYHAACYRNMEVEKECHTARQNYLSEYESFEQLKLNQETVLSKIKERIITREEMFRLIIEREKQRAKIAEGKLEMLKSTDPR